MNYPECGSKTECPDWELKKELGSCRRCIFYAPNYSKGVPLILPTKPDSAWVGEDSESMVIEEMLRKRFPHGHRQFIPLMLKHIKLHSDKNHDYAHGGHPLGNFTRVATILKQYPGLDPGDPVVVAITYLLKQLDASLWLKAKGHKAKIQGTDERWSDVSVYANIIQLIEKEEEDAKPK